MPAASFLRSSTAWIAQKGSLWSFSSSIRSRFSSMAMASAAAQLPIRSWATRLRWPGRRSLASRTASSEAPLSRS